MNDELFNFWCDSELVNHLDGCEDGAYVITRSEMKEILKGHDKLVEALKSLAYCAENNTGAHPSVDCYYRALDESKELLKELGHEI